LTRPGEPWYKEREIRDMEKVGKQKLPRSDKARRPNPKQAPTVTVSYTCDKVVLGAKSNRW